MSHLFFDQILLVLRLFTSFTINEQTHSVWWNWWFRWAEWDKQQELFQKLQTFAFLTLPWVDKGLKCWPHFIPKNGQYPLLAAHSISTTEVTLALDPFLDYTLDLAKFLLSRTRYGGHQEYNLLAAQHQPKWHKIRLSVLAFFHVWSDFQALLLL